MMGLVYEVPCQAQRRRVEKTTCHYRLGVFSALRAVHKLRKGFFEIFIFPLPSLQGCREISLTPFPLYSFFT